MCLHGVCVTSGLSFFTRPLIPRVSAPIAIVNMKESISGQILE